MEGMVKKITTIIGIFTPALAFILPSVFIEEDHMQLYISPPINKVEPKKAELQRANPDEPSQKKFPRLVQAHTTSSTLTILSPNPEGQTTIRPYYKPSSMPTETLRFTRVGNSKN